MDIVQIRVRVVALVPTQAYGNVTIEAEAISTDDAPNAADLVEYVKSVVVQQVKAMPNADAAKWVTSVEGGQ